MKTRPTVARLRETFAFDVDTGILTRRSTGKAVGSKEHAGYLVAKVDGTVHRVHRMGWAIATGAWPKGEIDHRNGQRQDNRLANLRDVTKQGNSQNLREAQRNNSTGILGVSWDKARGKFVAQITVNSRPRFLGRYATAEHARAAYIDAKRRLHPTCEL